MFIRFERAIFVEAANQNNINIHHNILLNTDKAMYFRANSSGETVSVKEWPTRVVREIEEPFWMFVDISVEEINEKILNIYNTDLRGAL